MNATTAFFFSGQGSTFPGMGKDICKHWRIAARWYRRISKITNVDVRYLSFNSSQLRLMDPLVSHLVILAHTSAAFAVLNEHGVVPNFAAGYSLGEVNAMVCAGAFSMDEGIKLISRRGQLLQECIADRPGSMISVKGISIETLRETLALHENVYIAIHLSDDETILSGGSSDIRRVTARLNLLGAYVRVIPVAGAYHSPLLKRAAAKLNQEFNNIAIRDPHYPIICGTSGQLMTSGAAVKNRLEKQMISPVRWDLVLRKLRSLAVTIWIEVGPGRGLTIPILRADKTASVFKTNSATALERACRVRRDDNIAGN